MNKLHIGDIVYEYKDRQLVNKYIIDKVKKNKAYADKKVFKRLITNETIVTLKEDIPNYTYKLRSAEQDIKWLRKVLIDTVHTYNMEELNLTKLYDVVKVLLNNDKLDKMHTKIKTGIHK
jgi:hypothetical protein